MVLIKGLVIFFLCTTTLLVQSQKDDWWKSATIYQIAPLSFKDTTGDGKGDIQGIISKLDYLVETGIDVILLSPFFQTQMVDFAYDITNYIEVDSIFGTMKDVEELFTKAKEKGLKVILDFVPNHTSNKHEWFIKSEVGTDGYKDFYIWHDGAKQVNEGRNLPPNSWKSEYGGSSWTWSGMREAYYYHKFAKEQPDLNLREELVVQKLNEVLKFWLDKGCDGFRVDAISQLFEDPAFLDIPDKLNDLPQTYALIERWRKLLDDYSNTESKILIPQVWNSPIDDLMRYYVSEDGTPRAQVPMNFMLINELNKDSTASDYKRVIEKYLSALPTGAIANWFLGSHDHNRVASRMGQDRIDGLMILLQTLPGISFTYYGDEIGMEDHTDISWDDTVDIQACNADRNSYKPLSRDVARTPFQWDKTENSGFTSGNPWLPVHPDYVENNLESQMSANKSHYKLFKELTALRKNATLALGDFEIKVLGNNTLAYARTYENLSYLTVINLADKEEDVDASGFKINFKMESKIRLAVPNSKHEIDEIVNMKNLHLTPYDAIIIEYYSSATKVTLSLLAVMMIIVKLFL